MSVATLPAAETDTIKLIARYRDLRVPLEAATRQFTERYGWMELDKGKTIVFRDYRAEIPAEWMPLLERHPAFSGVGHPKWVFLEGEMIPDHYPTEVKVVSGLMTAPTSRAPIPPPLPGWDTMSARQCVEAIERGRIRDPEAAHAYEMAHERRKTVARALHDLLLDGPGAHEEPPAEPPQAIMPSGQGAA